MVVVTLKQGPTTQDHKTYLHYHCLKLELFLSKSNQATYLEGQSKLQKIVELVFSLIPRL